LEVVRNLYHSNTVNVQGSNMFVLRKEIALLSITLEQQVCILCFELQATSPAFTQTTDG